MLIEKLGEQELRITFCKEASQNEGMGDEIGALFRAIQKRHDDAVIVSGKRFGRSNPEAEQTLDDLPILAAVLAGLKENGFVSESLEQPTSLSSLRG